MENPNIFQNCSIIENSRKYLDNFIDDKSVYIILKSFANNKAAQILNGKKVNRMFSFDSKSDYEKMYGSNSGLEQTVELKYKKSLRDLYEYSLSSQAKEAYGDNYVSFDLFITKNIHFTELQDAIYFPKVHIIRNCNASKFRKIFSDIHSKESLKIIKEKEAPQNYNMGEVKTLFENNINPLRISFPWVVDGITLRNAVKFLVPCFIFKNESYSFSED